MRVEKNSSSPAKRYLFHDDFHREIIYIKFQNLGKSERILILNCGL